MNLQPVERQTLAKVVIERLMEYVRGGTFQPGDALPSQHELARQLSVSRPVLREAMQGLATVGLIEIRPGSGCYVRDLDGLADPDTLFEVFTHDAAIEVLEARMVVEVELAALAAERATEADLRQLEAILARLKRAVRRGQATVQITSDFHQALARAGHNSVLYRMAQRLTRPRITQGLRVEHALPDIAAGEYESHRRLYEAVRSGDPVRARAELRQHLEIAHGWEDQIASLRSGLAEAVTPS
ncbi:MAG: FadR/GntR family transcriptional regulator [Thermomicrobiales bacterium]